MWAGRPEWIHWNEVKTEKFPGFFLLGSLVKFQEICSVYPLNAPSAVRHAAPHFELGHNLYVSILLINLGLDGVQHRVPLLSACIDVSLW